MPRTTEDILNLYWDRKRDMDPRLSKMLELQMAYKGDMTVPLPEMGQAEKPLVANLIASGLDQYAMRIASTLPDVWCPPARKGDFNIHTERAQQRRDAIRSWWYMNRLHLLMRKRARYLVGYASAPAVIRPRPPRSSRRASNTPIPHWQIRDPLTSLPPPGDDIDPPDCIFTFRRTYRWLQDTYPEAARLVERPKECSPDESFELLEYMDDETLNLIVLGRAPVDNATPNWYAPGPRQGVAGSRPYVELERLDNRSGICPAVVPGRICLSEPQGQFDGLLGLYWWQAKLMALGGIAAERDVFPEEWLESRPNETAQIVVAADGPQGIIGEVQGGQIRATHAPPGQATMLMIDRTERAMRVGGAVPAEFGAESPTNIRTARRGAEVLSSAIDFPIQEVQEIFETALQEENIRAIAWARLESGPRSFYYQWNGRGAQGTYDPAETFDTDENIVRYSMPGSDMNDMVVTGGQRVGMGTLSKYRFMEIDPMVDDPEAEQARVVVEGLRAALLQGLQTMASQPGGIPIPDLARIIKLTNRGKTLEEAVDIVQREAQERQSPQSPVAPDAPEAMPGLAMPGQGAEAGTEAIPEQAPSIGNFLDMLRGGGTMERAMT